MTEQDLIELKMEMEQELKEEAFTERMMRTDYEYAMERYIETIEEAQGLLDFVVKSMESYGWSTTRDEVLNYV